MSLWAKLSVDILGDPKLMRASRMGSNGLEFLPWFIAWAKRAEDGGRLTIDGEPATIADFRSDIPCATTRKLESAIDALLSIGVLQREADGALALVKFSKRQYGKPSNTPERTRDRKRASRHHVEDVTPSVTPPVTPPVTRDVTPAVTPLSHGRAESGERRVKREEQRAESGERDSSPYAPDDFPSAEDDWTPPSALANQPPDPDPFVGEYDRAAPTAPLVVLPIEAERLIEQLYSLGTEKRQLDVRRQLYDALDPRGRGARLRKGVHVKARSPEHLAACCRAVIDDPPRNIDAAIVIVLEKLQDPPPGPTPSEIHKASDGALRAEEEQYQRAAKAAGVRWAHEHPDEYEPIRAEIDQAFAKSSGSAFGELAKQSALTQRCARAAGFPDFATWQAGRASGHAAMSAAGGAR